LLLMLCSVKRKHIIIIPFVSFLSTHPHPQTQRDVLRMNTNTQQWALSDEHFCGTMKLNYCPLK
jgi:hypothetical protein